MRMKLINAASFEPLEIADLKARPELRIATTDDDAVLADLLKSAIEAYQEYTDNILCLSVWDMYLDQFPEGEGEIETPAPLSVLTNDSPPTVSPVITYYDENNTLQTLATTVYKADTTSEIAGRITLRYGQVWETTYAEVNTVIVRFAAGYASAAAIPRRIKDGLILKVQELYDGIDRSAAYERCWASYRRFHGI